MTSMTQEQYIKLIQSASELQNIVLLTPSQKMERAMCDSLYADQYQKEKIFTENLHKEMREQGITEILYYNGDKANWF